MTGRRGRGRAVRLRLRCPFASIVRFRMTQPAVSSGEHGTGQAGRSVRSRPRLAVLDGLRLVAALWVVSFHLVGIGSSAWEAPTWRLFPLVHHVARYGWLGVYLFFVISGFVICMSALGRSVGEFGISRVTRLFPAYWFGIFATTAVLTLLPNPRRHAPLADVLVNLTMLQNPLGVASVDPSYWTLWQEMLFYLIFAIVVWRGLTYRRVVVFCLFWLVAAIVAPRSGIPLLSAVAQPDFAPFFIAGIVMFLMHRFRPNLMLWGLLGVCVLVATLPVMSEIRIWGPTDGPGPTWRGILIFEILIFASILAVALGWIRASGRWLTVAGALTYPLYLLHQCIGVAVIRALHDRVSAPVLLGGVVLALLLASWAVHRLVERPMVKLMKPRLTSALADIRAWSVPDVRKPKAPAPPSPASGPPVGPVGAPPADPVGEPATSAVH